MIDSYSDFQLYESNRLFLMLFFSLLFRNVFVAMVKLCHRLLQWENLSNNNNRNRAMTRNYILINDSVDMSFKYIMQDYLAP